MNFASCTGSLHVPLAPAEARALFTAEGERRWAPGWAPAYPGGHRDVFVTHGGATTWIVVGDLRYARVRTGVDAGTVHVRCEPEGAGTRAHVRYDLTALGPEARLAEFAAAYPAMMAEWERRIAASL